MTDYGDSCRKKIRLHLLKGVKVGSLNMSKDAEEVKEFEMRASFVESAGRGNWQRS